MRAIRVRALIEAGLDLEILGRGGLPEVWLRGGTKINWKRALRRFWRHHKRTPTSRRELLQAENLSPKFIDKIFEKMQQPLPKI